MNREQRRNGVIERRIEEAAEAIREYGDVKVDEQANGESLLNSKSPGPR